MIVSLPSYHKVKSSFVGAKRPDVILHILLYLPTLQNMATVSRYFFALYFNRLKLGIQGPLITDAEVRVTYPILIALKATTTFKRENVQFQNLGTNSKFLLKQFFLQMCFQRVMLLNSLWKMCCISTIKA